MSPLPSPVMYHASRTLPSTRFPLFSNLNLLFTRQMSTPSTPGYTNSPPCFEFSRLPRASRLKSLRYKRTLPGRSGHLAYHPSTSSYVSLDPSHPFVSLSIQQLHRAVPHYRCALFSLHCFPFAVLKKFDQPDYMLAYKQKDCSNELYHIMSSVDPKMKVPPPTQIFANDNRRKKDTLPMPVMVLIPKHIHKSAFVRSKIKSRFKEALRMVVIRGAIQSKSGSGIDFVATEALSPLDVLLNEQLVLKDSVYTIRPNLGTYSAPWPILITEIRRALEYVKQYGFTMHRKDVRGSVTKRPTKTNSIPRG